MKKILNKNFFERDTIKVAKELLGKFLVRKIGDKEEAFMIMETEAYDGFFDKASHASKGETTRNKPMFEKAGIFYVYLVYGMYEMLNVVTREKNYPAAVLIRGVSGLDGPGKLTKKLKISRALNGKEAKKESGLWFEDRGIKISQKQILKLPRIGVSYAGPVWSKKPWRFSFKNEI